MDQVILDETVTDVVTFDDGSVSTLVQQNFDVVTVGGEQGPPGRDGASVGATGISGAIISAHSMIVNIGGLLYPADCSDLAHFGQVIGMANQAANAPNISIEYSGDGGQSPSGSFVAGKQYFLGKNGAIVDASSIPNDAVFLQFVGLGKDVTTFLVELEDPTLLS